MEHEFEHFSTSNYCVLSIINWKPEVIVTKALNYIFSFSLWLLFLSICNYVNKYQRIHLHSLWTQAKSIINKNKIGPPHSQYKKQNNYIIYSLYLCMDFKIYMPLPRIVPLHQIKLHNLCAENTDSFLLLLNFNNSPQKLIG